MPNLVGGSGALIINLHRILSNYVLKVIFHKNLLAVNKELSLNKVLEDIQKIKAVRITFKDMPVILRTELEENAHYAFKAVGLKIPPRLLSGISDIQEKVVLRL